MGLVAAWSRRPNLYFIMRAIKETCLFCWASDEFLQCFCRSFSGKARKRGDSSMHRHSRNTAETQRNPADSTFFVGGAAYVEAFVDHGLTYLEGITYILFFV